MSDLIDLDKELDRNESLDSFIQLKYQKLNRILSTEITSFERKNFTSLSHEPNKAMNINCYLHLMGSSFNIQRNGNRNKLVEINSSKLADLTVPYTKFVMTVDADSMLLADYTQKLIYEMEKKENHRVAVIQTPYSAYPGAELPVEVVAGATTDIQYNIHQGFTYYNATYWVGANALLRRQALDDIKFIEIQGEVILPRYIQDRTVIEDTESTIDLVSKGWSLYNYPERLAYSSTPPDFGTLIIQRARWANGGLIIFPKLVRYLLMRPFILNRWKEFIIRANYLTSIAGVNIGTLLLLLIPFNDSLFSWWLPVAAVFYYAMYARDLKLSGYKKSDLLRVYALNLILIPINIAGVIKSIEQGLTRKKIPFKRTPKIGDRTVAEVKFLFFQYVLTLYMLFAFLMDIWHMQLIHALYSAINEVLLIYAILIFIGLKATFSDIKSQLFLPRI